MGAARAKQRLTQAIEQAFNKNNMPFVEAEGVFVGPSRRLQLLEDRLKQAGAMGIVCGSQWETA
jgi:hypothetical protein